VLQISPAAAPATGSLPPATPSSIVLGGNPNPNPGAGSLPLRNNPPAPVPASMPSVYGAPPLEPASSNPPQRNEGSSQQR